MLEIEKTAEFTKDVYGGKGYLSGMKQVENWLASQRDRLLHPRYKRLVDAIGNETKLEDILSVFNTDSEGRPIIGSWMLMECSKTAQKLANTWGKYQVSADRWKDTVMFTPDEVHFQNGKKIKATADGVEVYTVVPKGKAGFFKAYQYIKAGVAIKFTCHVPEDLCEKIEGRGKDKVYIPDEEKSLACANEVLDRMQLVCLGAYRLRFGNFKYV